MSPAAKVLLVLLVTCCILAGILIVPQLVEEGSPPIPGPTDRRTDSDPGQRTPPANASELRQQGLHQRSLVEYAPPVTTAAIEQGVHGRVLRPYGGPAAGVAVLLWKDTAVGRESPAEPVGQLRTNEAGRFRMAVDSSGQGFQLAIVSDEYLELRQRIAIRRKEWLDAGDLHLEEGSIVRGRVIAEDGKLPLAGATVFLRGNDPAQRALPAPGRERGAVATTDASGFFRYTNAPHRGLVRIGAEAPGYAQAELTNQPIAADGPTYVTIELPRGVPIGGRVRDTEGEPVRHATVTASRLGGNRAPRVTADADGDGRFQLSVRDGPYLLGATADGYGPATQPVVAGETGVEITLEERGRVHLRVLAADGSPIQHYAVSLRRYSSSNPGVVGMISGFDNLRVTPADHRNGFATIRKVPDGQFVFQIADSRHAKTQTAPFTMSSSHEPPSVEVTLSLGASIVGIVVDDHDRPVTGAIVETEANGLATADIPRLLALLPDTHTPASTKTDHSGRFELSRLSLADYQLRVEHPDFCERVVTNVFLDSEGQQGDVGSVQLQRGAIVEGVCLLGSNPGVGFAIAIGPPEGSPRGQAFRATAHTDAEGRYVFMTRIPPGSYRIHAWRPDDLPGRLTAMQQTQRELVVSPGQEHSVQNFRLQVR